ncbi:hypothetical protein [Arthrobacter antioxidans]|uniref:hypothetical protein n=1 Tax=Arthrobacter antioxidans TaxID=2895818 RepID=UPI001FFFDC3A|nr:hypothetical protein [Arthrobacter antioxidans]
MTEDKEIIMAKFDDKDWKDYASFSFFYFVGTFLVYAFLWALVPLAALLFVPELRSPTYVIVFSCTLGLAWTIKFWRSTSMKVKARLSTCSDRINVVLTELSGNPAQNMTPEQLEQLIVSGARHEFDVNGVPGAYLLVRKEQEPEVEKNAGGRTGKKDASKVNKCWQVAIGVEAPPHGTESFDRLFHAATSGSR